MNDGLKLLISLSISGSIIAIFLFALKLVIKDRLSKTWQYYIWLIVILRLLIPLSMPTNIVGELFSKTEDYNYTNTIIDNNINKHVTNRANTYVESTTTDSSQIQDLSSTSQKYFDILINNMLIISLFISILLLVKKVTSYKSFVSYIKAGRRNINDEEIVELLESMCNELKIKKVPELYSNKMVSSSMLVGIINPFIVIPETQLATKENLKYIFLHELSHLKRHDIIYKWLVQITICIHWFNPLLYFVRREINNACELACDEAVIKKFDDNGKISYGDTLISSLELGGNYGNEIVSLTLCENGKFLKERLKAIMKFGEKSRLTVLVSIVLTVTFGMGAIVVGAYNNNTAKLNTQNYTKQTQKDANYAKQYNNWNISQNAFEQSIKKSVDKTGDIKRLETIAYTMSQDAVDEIAINYFNKTGNINNLSTIAYYMSIDGVDQLAKNYFNKTGNIDGLNSIAYYMSTDGVDQLARDYFDKTGNIDGLNSMAYYMSTDGVDQIAKDCFYKTKDSEALSSLNYYMSKDVIDEIFKDDFANKMDKLDNNLNNRYKYSGNDSKLINAYYDYEADRKWDRTSIDNNLGNGWDMLVGGDPTMNGLTPNVVKHIKTISQSDVAKVSEVYIDAYNCGIIIEKSQNNDFELDYVGIKDESIYDVKTSILSLPTSGSTKLSITAKSDEPIKKISLSGENIVNAIRIKVPEKEYKNFFIKVDGAVLLPNLQSNVRVESTDGVIKVKDKIISSPLEMVSNSGVINLFAQTITSPLTIKNDDGVVEVSADEIKNDITIGGNNNKNTDGVVKLIFSKTPDNIHLILNTDGGVVKLPRGWSRETVLGNGKPVVTILNEDGVTEINSY